MLVCCTYCTYCLFSQHYKIAPSLCCCTSIPCIRIVCFNDYKCSHYFNTVTPRRDLFNKRASMDDGTIIRWEVFSHTRTLDAHRRSSGASPKNGPLQLPYSPNIELIRRETYNSVMRMFKLAYEIRGIFLNRLVQYTRVIFFSREI